MKDINYELEQILIKNKIIKKTNLDKVIQQLFDFKSKLSSQSVIGLYGTSMEADSLLHFVFSYIPDITIHICFDKTVPTYTYKNHIKERKVYKIEELVNYKVDYMIIGSYNYRSEMKQTLNSNGFQGKIIDIYDSLAPYIEEHFADYEMIFIARKAFLDSGQSEKVELTKKLVKYYLNIKDFKSAHYYIRYYIDNKFPEFEQYEQLEQDIHKLLEDIKAYLKQRNKQDIIVNWVDALPYEKIGGFPFLKSKAEEGVCFENAYTVMPWTRGVLRTILYGKYPVKDMLFLREEFKSEDVEVLKLLSENNYGFAYCGLGIYAKSFDDKVTTVWDIYTNKNVSSVTRQWDAVSLMCKSEKPLLILIHTMYETHGPYICGEADTLIRFSFSENDWNDERCQKQADISGKYIDGQMNFYEKLYGDNAFKIYMSDHGNIGDCIMEDHKVHIIFIIDHKEICHENIQGMFSLVDFPQIIDMLLKQRFKWKSLERDKVIVETYDAYDERKVNDILDGKLEKRNWLQCRGVITKQDKYFLYADREEYYFLNGQEKKNEIGNRDYFTRIQELKKECDLPFINIYEHDEFKNSRKLYE